MPLLKDVQILLSLAMLALAATTIDTAFAVVRDNARANASAAGGAATRLSPSGSNIGPAGQTSKSAPSSTDPDDRFNGEGHAKAGPSADMLSPVSGPDKLRNRNTECRRLRRPVDRFKPTSPSDLETRCDHWPNP